MKLSGTIILLLFTFFMGFSQSRNDLPENDRKGKLYFYWGWNWSWYSNSNIHFVGSNYDFTLYEVSAKDRQSKFSANYLNPFQITIPQYNFRIGYYLKHNYSISFGIDHMKYVVQQNQSVKISGNINNSGTQYDGMYDEDDIIIQEGFLLFEHTDGLNYVNIDFRRIDEFYRWKKIKFNVTEGLGAGILYPKTNATLLNYERYDDFMVSGWGINAVVGLNILITKSFFIQSEFKAGYINMPDIKTTNYDSDQAKQDFFFTQLNITFGANINLKKKDKR